MGVKVSAGAMRGKNIPVRLFDSHHGDLRPTSSKVRESIFNILRDGIKDSLFVDLYAGTGAVGIEAMSRGAKSVYFVEADARRAAGIEKLLRGCGCRPRAVIINQKAEDFLLKSDEKFDIVFLDPPYNTDDMERVLSILGDGRVLSEEAVVIAEHLSKKTLPERAGMLMKGKVYKYGDTSLTLYRRER